MSDQPQNPSLPYENEPRGPVGELAAGASAEVRAEILGDDDAAQEAWQQGVEPEGIEATQIAAIVVATLLAVAVLVVTGIWLTFGGLSGAVTVAEDVDDYPELRDTRADAISLIGEEAWGVISAEDGIYRIPVSAAMGAVVQQYEQRQAGANLVQPPTYWTTQDLANTIYAADANVATDTPTGAALLPSDEGDVLEPAAVAPLPPDDLSPTADEAAEAQE